jgi:hypothetical protein
MVEIEIPLPADADPAAVEAAIEAGCDAEELRTQLKGTLSSCPGCIHWHFKRGREPGTLEITLWPRRHRAWISVHANRSAPWIDELLPRLRESLAQRLVSPDYSRQPGE